MMSEASKDEILRTLYNQYYKGSTRDDTCVKIKNGFLDAVADRFGWTVPQAYVATDYLFRPENMN